MLIPNKMDAEFLGYDCGAQVVITNSHTLILNSLLYILLL